MKFWGFSSFLQIKAFFSVDDPFRAQIDVYATQKSINFVAIKDSIFIAKLSQILTSKFLQIQWIASLQVRNQLTATMDLATRFLQLDCCRSVGTSCTGSSTKAALKIKAICSETFTPQTSKFTRTSTSSCLSSVSVSTTQEWVLRSSFVTVCWLLSFRFRSRLTALLSFPIHQSIIRTRLSSPSKIGPAVTIPHSSESSSPNAELDAFIRLTLTSAFRAFISGEL